MYGGWMLRVVYEFAYGFWPLTFGLRSLFFGLMGVTKELSQKSKGFGAIISTIN
jgi:hypothetical protein